MAKKKDKIENLTAEQVYRIRDIIMALVTVYGPIDLDDLVDDFALYFPKEYKLLDEKDLFDFIFTMEEKEFFYISKDEEASLFSDEELKSLKKLTEGTMIRELDLHREFDDPEELLNYAEIYDIRNNKRFDDLKDYVLSLEYKEPEIGREILNEIIFVISRLYDNDGIIPLMHKAVKGKFDEKKLLTLMDDMTADLPRGIFGGYSFNGLRETAEKVFKEEEHSDDKIEKPKKPLSFGSYTYEQCLVLVNKLAKTPLFSQFCSDNIIELIINGREIYLQLLGYYNNDRDIIFYGDRHNMEYNIHFMTSPEGSYPDIASRIDFNEIAVDDPEGFISPELRVMLKHKKLPEKPLIFHIDPVKKAILSEKKDLDMIGAVLDSLNKIYTIIGGAIGDLCVEGDNNHIVQLYLDKKGVQMGAYRDNKLGGAILPYEDEEIDYVDVKATEEADLSIGIYSVAVFEEEKRSYMGIIYDRNKDLFIGYDLCKEDELKGMKNRIVKILEDKNIRPSSLVFNNEFAVKALDDLCVLYEVNYSFELGDKNLDDFYLRFMDMDEEDRDDIILN